jgi:hypothetical protein
VFLHGTLIAYACSFLVCGLDKWSGAQELVTGLLVDPVTGTAPYLHSLENRWNDATQERVDIS